MDKQIKYLLGVLILLLISAYFLSLLGGLPQYFKDDIIAFMEDRLSGEISFSSVSFWPLNRIKLKEFSYVDQAGNQLNIEELNLDYRLNLTDFEKIIELKFIEAKTADIKITKEIFKNYSAEKKEAVAVTETTQFDSLLKNNKLDLAQVDLPSFMENIKVNILDSRLIVENQNNNLELTNLNLGLKAEEKENYRLNFSTALFVRNFNYNNQQISDLQVENIDLEFKREAKSADLYLNMETFAAADFLKIINNKEYNYQNFKINLDSLSGSFDTRVKVEVKENNITNYKSSLNFEELNLEALYQNGENQENLNLSFNNLKLFLSGPKFNFLAAAQNSSLKSDSYKSNFDFSLKSDHNFNYQLNLALKKLENEILNLTESNLTIKTFQDEIFVEKAVINFADQSSLDITGSYNLKEKNYLLSAETENFKLSDKVINLLDTYSPNSNYIDHLQKFKDESFNFLVDLAGHYSEDKGFSAAGNLNFDFDFKNQGNDLKLQSEFWYVEQKLFINSFKLFSDFVYLDLLGEIDFASKNLNLRYAARNFEAAVLNDNFELGLDYLRDFNPTIKYFEGKIANSFDNPTLSLDLKADELSYQDYILKEIRVKALYENDNLKLTEARASINEGLVRLRGNVDQLFSRAELNLNLESENLYFQDLAAAFKNQLPLAGELDLTADLTGPINDYNLDFKLNTSDTIFSYQNREYDLSNLSAVVNKDDKNFELVDFSFGHRNLNFKAEGIYNFESGFDISYNLNNIEIQNYLAGYPEIADKISGSLKLSGDLKGEIGDSNLKFKLFTDKLLYDGSEFGIVESDFSFNLEKQNLNVNNFRFTFANGTYNLNGKIFDLTETPKSSLDLEFVEVPIKDLYQKYLKIYPFAQEIILKGESKFESEGSDYKLNLDLNAALAETKDQIINIKGNLAREINLKFTGENVPLNISTTDYAFNVDAEAMLNFDGSLSGNLESPILNLKHNLTAVKINNTNLKSIAGELLVEDQHRLSASESIDFVEGGKLNFDGSYSFAEEELSLSSTIDQLPLAFILSFFDDRLSGDGFINGSFRADGNLQSPNLRGELDFAGSSLGVGIWAPIENYKGTISLENNQALIDNLSADFVDGSFTLGGKFNLLDQNNFWDLNLDGKNLYFDYGSLTGNFDSVLSFSGPLLNPLLAGDLEVSDFIVNIPFKWPAAEGGNEVNPDAFIPRIDINIEPLSNVRVRSSNMSVLVEDGDLDLNYNHRRDNYLMMEGRLRSTEGRFTYYNSRFNLNNAEAIFTPVDENDIPSLQANATTYAGGREININVNGPANNMTINFSSTPEMTEEEILNLISTQGALGSAIIGGENIGIQQIIMQELIRIVNGFLQEDLISDLESDVRTAFSLDRIEIDALQYGLDREFNIYLGKNLSNRLYLEYASFFSEEERESEISFQYRLTEITTLKGSYFGDDEYQITIENEIEF